MRFTSWFRELQIRYTREGEGQGKGWARQAELLETRRSRRRYRQVVSGKKTFNCILGQVAWLIFIIAAVIIHNKAAGAQRGEGSRGGVARGELVKYVMCHKWQILRHTSLIPFGRNVFTTTTHTRTQAHTRLPNCCSICRTHTHTHAHAHVVRVWSLLLINEWIFKGDVNEIRTHKTPQSGPGPGPSPAPAPCSAPAQHVSN